VEKKLSVEEVQCRKWSLAEKMNCEEEWRKKSKNKNEDKQ